MLKSMRKYNKWFLVIFMVLLMVAWLAPPAASGVGEASLNRTVGSIDGEKVTARDDRTAHREIDALHSLAPWLTEGMLGIKDKSAAHWMLLSREAERAGLVGEESDGQEFLSQLAAQIAREQLQNDFQFMISIMGKSRQEQQQLLQDQTRSLTDAYKGMIERLLAQQYSMTQPEMNRMLARAHGAMRLVSSYVQANRVGPRQVLTQAKHDEDAAVADFVFLDAGLIADKEAEPDDAGLAAQFERFKGVKPGEGDFGIGYLLPQRIKLEWIKLSREAIENAVTLDPFEVRKRHRQFPERYPGDFAGAQANVERDMRSEAADRAMQEAHLAVQAETHRSVRKLELEPGTKYRQVPADWEQTRPQPERVALAIQAALKKNGLDVPLPEVTVKSSAWLTLDELAGLEGIGQSVLRQGGLSIPFAQVVSWTRELGNKEAGVVPVQARVMLVENFFEDTAKNRYYATILETRGESAPDSYQEIREDVARDFKRLQGFEHLKARSDEIRKVAVEQGLDAVAAMFKPAEGAAGTPAPEVRKGVRITRINAGDTRLNDEALRNAVVDAASAVDPLTPFGQVPAEQAFLVVPSPQSLGLAVLRLEAFRPLTIEQLRLRDNQIAVAAQANEIKLTDAVQGPFSLESLLRRHTYIQNDKKITSVDQLSADESSEG